jgi:hypothetical protein
MSDTNSNGNPQNFFKLMEVWLLKGRSRNREATEANR